MLVEIILIALMAGVGGTLVGGVIGVVVKKPNKNYIALMLSFAAGAMIGVSLFKLLPESYEYGGIWATMIGAAVGALFVLVLILFTDRLKGDVEDPLLLDVERTEKSKLKRIGIAVFVGMAIHGIPEGLAIGAGEHLGIGLLLGIVFFLHFVPEGLAIALPMRASGTKIWKILGLCFIAGSTTVLGAIAGYYIGMIDALLAYSLSFAAGAMLFIVFSEMIGMIYRYTDRHKLASIITIAGALMIVVLATDLH